ncbi:putative small nuclear ribonucleoprotein G [Zea mays]|uniref:Putative small nuclear ribonucleoprotein G n=1 Tax=Zea mays TaxID=4577 RepID=A0A1D6P885_MAIZE|nr:putative small nuclear ribonucleoprotein G [Zea mays]
MSRSGQPPDLKKYMDKKLQSKWYSRFRYPVPIVHLWFCFKKVFLLPMCPFVLQPDHAPKLCMFCDFRI